MMFGSLSANTCGLPRRSEAGAVSAKSRKAIRALYRKSAHISYNLGYSARERVAGKEIMFFGPSLQIPEARGAMEEVERQLRKRTKMAA
jgi:hypothetical protein